MIIDDTTLRDGAQTPGVCFSLEEKVKIVELLNIIGVEEIEAGIPAMGIEEQRELEKILEKNTNAKIFSWNRCLIDDVKASLETGVKHIEISLPLSDLQIHNKLRKNREWILKQLRMVLDFCAGRGLYISVGGEDASRGEIGFIIEYIKICEEFGANRFRYCDTVGILEPLKMFDIINQLRQSTKLDLEIHAHNDFGMATANSMSAVKAGATHVNTTVIGLGERAGNAPLEEVIMASKHVYNIEHNYKTEAMRELSEFVATVSGRQIDPGRPILGKNIFTHESGIHVDGVIKYPSNYEPYCPSEVGIKRRIVTGTHSGSGYVRKVITEEFGLVSNDILSNFIRYVKNKSLAYKQSFDTDELIKLYQDFVKDNAKAS